MRRDLLSLDKSNAETVARHLVVAAQLLDEDPEQALEHARAAVRLPAQDLDRARRWYAQSLGLEPVEEREGGLRYRCGGTEFVVFASTGRASGDHTQMGFTVPDLDRAVAELWERGVEFESEIVEVHGNYPSTGASGERATWFRDSEGNLLGLGQYSYD